jgi:hypothetical protein
VLADRSLTFEGSGSGSSEPRLERAQTLMLTVKRATDRAEQLLKNATCVNHTQLHCGATASRAWALTGRNRS